MELDEEYPKTCRKRTARIEDLLAQVSALNAEEREAIALSLNSMADKARDLDDIVDRLLNEPHSPAEIGQLLIALELTTEQLRGHSETIDGKLYEIAERLNAPKESKSRRKLVKQAK